MSNSDPFTYTSLQKEFGQGIPCPTDYSFPTHTLDEWTRKQPDQLALHWVAHDYSQEKRITYRQLSDLSNRAAIAFSQRGIKKGDRVMVQLPRVNEFWIQLFGLMRIGAVPCPGTTLLMAKDLKYRAESSRAVAFVGDVESCTRFEEIAKEVGVDNIFQVRTDGDGGVGSGRQDLQALVEAVSEGSKWMGPPHKSNDLALLYFTSGTTGSPKQVLLESEYILGHTITGRWYRLAPGKLFANMADLGWAKAAYSTFGCFNNGATLLVQPPPPGAFAPSHVLTMLNKYPVTSLCAPPTIYRTLVTPNAFKFIKENPFKALEHCVSAGEPLNASVIKQWKAETGIEIKDAWGQTETVIMVGNFEGEPVRQGSMGKVAPSCVVGIIDGQGKELPDGSEGELAVRTDVGGGSCWIFKGYIKNGKIDKREKLFGGKTWYSTGDRGIRDKDGYFWFVGRDDDVITSSGYRIGPFEVESALKAHPAVLESAAVGSPDAARGEIVKAFIQLSDEYRERYQGKSKKDYDELAVDIQNFFKKTTAAFKYPREIEFVESLPKTVSGKIRRVELRDLEYERKKDVAAALRARL